MKCRQQATVTTPDGQVGLVWCLPVLLCWVGIASAAEPHWAYQAPGDVDVPSVSLSPSGMSAVEIRNPIDLFVLSRLQREEIVPLGPAGRETLIRRVTLDLLGVPPTPSDIDRFLADRRPGAWERLVDRLLSSPRYGERWALPWLDAARFADSNGYQRDGRREAWGWRDWVIAALNDDMPFDQFTIEQLAGDLLPGAGIRERVATGFHRNTMANVEAGVDPEEERFLAVVDRVNTTATVWMGTTFECAQCHDHKYDPFSQKEYYGLFAMFNSTEAEIATAGSRRDFGGAMVRLPRSPYETSRARAAASTLQRLTADRKRLAAVLDDEQPAWESLVAERAAIPGWLKKILAIGAKRRKAAQVKRVRDYYRGLSADWTRLASEIKRWEAVVKRLAPATTLVMSELPRKRPTRLFERGDFLTPGESVSAGVPAVFPTLEPRAGQAEIDRLDLARWLVSGRHPLTSRVIVNRHWSEFFGRGLVATREDFGTRGAAPTHPGLLDWLASRWIRSGWSTKSLHRLLVTSGTYRRRSDAPVTLRERDPGNRFLARASRRRLPAELIRDNALSIAGLLSDKMHGPPVFPVQPSGVWNHIGVASNVWKTSQGEDLHRRGVYVYWRRTVPYPSFVSFDAPSREVCMVARSQSNTPLQALALLNDPVYAEAAGGLARQAAARHVETDPLPAARWLFRRATGRFPEQAEADILVGRFQAERARLVGDLQTTRVLLKSWLGRTKGSVEPADVSLVAWWHVANVVLNLDEVITRE